VQIRDYKTDRYLTYLPKDSTRKFCTEKDIMIGRYGPPVFQILRGIAGAYNVALMKALPLDGMDSEYIFHLLSCSYIQNIVIGNSQRTAGQTGVNLKLLNSIEISKPPIVLQNQFAERVQAIEEQKTQAQASLAQAEDLFNSLLQKAFKGKLAA
jgi:type I restriction enzyme S subunit